MSLRSALDYHANGSTTKVNATITVQKLNVVVVELGGIDRLSKQVYGVVDKAMRTENGETMAMARHFDMI